MSTASLPLRRTSLLRPKYLLFGFVGVMIAYVLFHNERFLIDSSHPEWAHIKSFKWYLLPHGIMGACALLLGPMQFSDRLRQRFAKFHRVVGRFYVAGVFIGAPLGFYVQYYEERMGGARSFSFAAFTDAAIWMFTTAIAIYFILKGKVQLHRQWMTRSFAVASYSSKSAWFWVSPGGRDWVTLSPKPRSGCASLSRCYLRTSFCSGRIFPARGAFPQNSRQFKSLQTNA